VRLQRKSPFPTEVMTQAMCSISAKGSVQPSPGHSEATPWGRVVSRTGSVERVLFVSPKRLLVLE